MATVWAGRDELLGRRVAVKCLDPVLARDEAIRDRFRHEAVAAAGLSHPFVVTTFDAGEDDGTAFIVMELVEGESLRQLLDHQGVLDPGPAAAIGAAVADALEYAHRQGIVHRDVKPANVLLAANGGVKVTDFGIAKAIGADDLTRTGTLIGTARYLAPEQVQGQPAGPRSDVYALGLVLYEMLAGRPAFSGDTEMATAVARLAGPPPDLTAVRPGLPPALVSLVTAALQPDPAHRVPSAAALAQGLRSVAAGAAPPPTGPNGPSIGRPASPEAATASRTAPTPTTPPAPVARRSGGFGRFVGWVAFLVLLVVLGVGAYVVTTRVVDDGTDPSPTTTVPTGAVDGTPAGGG